MPTINQLDLTMSRDSNGVVAARIEYALEFGQFEVDANPRFVEQVALVRSLGLRDRWEAPTLGRGAVAVQTRAGDGDTGDDRVVVMLSDGDVDAATLGVTLVNGVGTAKRSFEHTLSRAELELFLEPGRDHPYAMVSVMPVQVQADVKLASVEMLDVGDPEPVYTVDVGGEPVALAADGRGFFWVATAEGEVVRFDRYGAEQNRLAIGGQPTALATYNGYVFFAALANGTYQRFEEVGVLGQPLATGGTEPVAIAAAATVTWVANAGTSSVTQISPNGVESTTDVGGRPVALVLGTDGLVYVAVPGRGQVFAIDAAGKIVRNYAMPAMHALAVGEGVFAASLADLPGLVLFQANGASEGVNLIETSLRGVALGAGAVWVVSGWRNTLVRVRLADRQPVVGFPVGEGCDAVLFDADRLYVANRTSRTVSIVRATVGPGS